MNRVALNRRSLVFGGMAVGACSAWPAWAQEQTSSETPKDYLPTVVTIEANLLAGEIHVLPSQFRLYWTLANQQALRFSIGVARPELWEPGHYRVAAKREWPSWKPTPEMIARDPERYAPHADGMPGGPDNPLGARALYLFDDAGNDTMLRIHGTNDPSTIGTAVSNGCARLTNDHVTILYDAVPVGTQVFLYRQSAAVADIQVSSSIPTPD